MLWRRSYIVGFSSQFDFIKKGPGFHRTLISIVKPTIPFLTQVSTDFPSRIGSGMNVHISAAIMDGVHQVFDRQ